jgi:hypothetical protein
LAFQRCKSRVSVTLFRQGESCCSTLFALSLIFELGRQIVYGGLPSASNEEAVKVLPQPFPAFSPAS